MKEIGRNDPCPCGSGKKYKKCCMEKDMKKKQSQGQNWELDNEEYFSEDEILADEENENQKERDEFDNVWDEFIDSDFDDKVAIIKRLFKLPDLQDEDFFFELFNNLNDSAETKVQRNKFSALVKELKEEIPSIYRDLVGFLLHTVISNKVSDKDVSDVSPLFLEFAAHADQDIDYFNMIVDLLAYHGQLELLTEGFRIAWEKVKDSNNVVPWGINEFAERGIDFEIFSYLEHAKNPEARNPKLLKRIEYYVEEIDLEYHDLYFSTFLRMGSPTWKLESLNINPNVSSKSKKINCSNNIWFLSNEFLDYLHRDKKIPYSKAALMRADMSDYLINRLNGRFGKPPKKLKTKPKGTNLTKVLCPDRLTFDDYLFNLASFLNARYYRAWALYESVPYWLSFLELNDLIDEDESYQAYNSILPLFPVLIEDLKFMKDDEIALQALSKAWGMDVSPV